MDHGIMFMLQMQSSSDCGPPNKDGVVSVLNDPFGSHHTALLIFEFWSARKFNTSGPFFRVLPPAQHSRIWQDIQRFMRPGGRDSRVLLHAVATVSAGIAHRYLRSFSNDKRLSKHGHLRKTMLQ